MLIRIISLNINTNNINTHNNNTNHHINTHTINTHDIPRGLRLAPQRPARDPLPGAQADAQVRSSTIY